MRQQIAQAEDGGHVEPNHGPRIWKFARALDAVMPNLHLFIEVA